MEIIVTVESKLFYRYFTIHLAPEKCWSLKMSLFYQNLIFQSYHYENDKLDFNATM